MSRRVVVTGLGAITPIGLSVEEFGSPSKKERSDLHRSQNLIHQNINVTLQQK